LAEQRADGLVEIVNAVLDGSAPHNVRSAAARGALPLPRSELVRLYVALLEDEDEEIRVNADANLRGLDSPAVCDVLADANCVGDVLEYFVARATRDEKIAEKITFRAEVPPAAIEKLASSGTAAVIELVLTNQERLLCQPRLLHLLSTNPALRVDQRGRILELLDRATRARPGTADADGEEGEALSAVAEEAARLLQVDIGELFAASEIIDGDEFDQAEDPGIRDAYRRIITLNTAQKAILAMRGGREERMILVRDSNKLVSSAVLRNPRITEDDVETYARMRSLPGEVLRGIALKREWIKSYPIVVALVNNPKTPPSVSTNLISRLQNAELKRIKSNHDLPELIRRMARRTLDVRTQQGSKLKKR
jgi:hypothetical protein